MRRYQGHDVGYGETRDGDGRVPRGMPVAGYMLSSGRRRSKGTDERALASMMSPRSSSRDKLWRTMLLFSQPREDWLHGEVDAFDSTKFGQACEESARSDDKAEKDAAKLNEERGDVKDKMSAVKLAKEFHGGDTSSYP